ncbi:MAG TPA: transcription termination factor NusA [Bacillota bacterium]|nr:transcription termination factor NusA [Bacillota bacterium]
MSPNKKRRGNYNETREKVKPNPELIRALEQIGGERGISTEVLIDAIEAALISAYKRNFGSGDHHVGVVIDRNIGAIRVLAKRLVVEEVEHPQFQISVSEARGLDPRYEVGDFVETEVTPAEFGRIAAQTAKQVVVQRIREAERGVILEEFASREGDIVTAVVQRHEQKSVILDLGRTETTLSPAEQMPNERYRHGERLKVYVVEARPGQKGPDIVVSRTHPGLIKRLLEFEVPEIHDGVVEIKAIAREPGSRAKVAVWSRDENVDPVGACVGTRGSRVQAVVNELRGEKIDIVRWDPIIEAFVAKALSPATATGVELSPAAKTARVVVPDHQLSLAIGREGQNARLAAKLTGWRIDIRSESQRLLEQQARDAARAAADDAEFELELGGEDPAADEAGPVDGDGKTVSSEG